MRYVVKTAANRYSALPEYDEIMRAIFPNRAEWERRTPLVDVVESEDGYTLEAELPGVAESSIDVRIEDNLLTITAREQEAADSADEKTPAKRHLLRERPPLEFGRSFALPKDVNRDSIDARYHNGVLTVTLTKTAESRPRTIPINN